MPEYIGTVEIPAPPDLGTFPLPIEFGMVTEIVRPVVTHTFEASGAKRTQRFGMGPGYRRFRISAHWSASEYNTLAAWFESVDGAYGQFTFDFCRRDGSDESITARFATFALSVDHLADAAAAGTLEIVEVPSNSVSYTSGGSVDRVPSGGLATSLLDGVQEIIPLVKITPKASGASAIYLSDRRVTVDGNLYQPRILDYNPGTQSLGAASSDEAYVELGNADGVISQLVEEVSLHKAKVEISFLHVDSLTKLNWWAGHIARFPDFGVENVENGTYRLLFSEAAYELGLGYPFRSILDKCGKKFDDDLHCPYASVGSGGHSSCGKTWTECQARGMDNYFGGVEVPNQLVRVKDNSTGTFGFGRSSFQSATVPNPSAYDRPVREIFTDLPMTVPADVIAGRDEGDFYTGLGVIGAGVLGSFSSNLADHLIDNQPPHDSQRGGGFRYTLGTDPAGDSDYVGISQAPWSGPSAFPNATYAAGLSMVEIRRTDEKGLQLTKVGDRSMSAVVTTGRGGWVWSAPGSRSWQAGLTNPTWIAVNVWLEAIGLKIGQAQASSINATQMERYFDVSAAIAAAAIDDTIVSSLESGGGSEKQFVFRGMLQERKPVRDWLGEIGSCALKTFWWKFGKFYPVTRINATATEAFTDGNVLYNGYQHSKTGARFNHLEVVFGDSSAKFQQNKATYFDEAHATAIGLEGQPQRTTNQLSSVGMSTASQAARIAAILTREEVCGVTEAEFRKKGTHTIRTTILAAGVTPGMVVSYVGRMSRNQTVKFRVREVALEPDFSMTITGETVVDSMYNLATGPAAIAATGTPPDVETFAQPQRRAWYANQVAGVGPIYDADSRTFDLRQSYAKRADAANDASLVVTGMQPINTFVPGVRATEIRASSATTGGAIPGQAVLFACIAPYDADGVFGPPSNTVIHVLGTGYYDLNITSINWPDGTWSGYALFAGYDGRSMCMQTQNAGALPSSIVFSAVLKTETEGVPAVDSRMVEVRAKNVVHGAINGGPVTSVTAPNKIIVSDFADAEVPIDEFVGRTLIIWSDKSDGSAPPWAFEITGWDATTGEFTVTPDCVAAEPEDSVQVGDVAGVALQTTGASSTTIADAKLFNQQATTGLEPDAEIGYEIRILFGKGKGQVRRIVANDHDTYTIEPAWEVTPDTTSIFIVCEPTWKFVAQSTPTQAATPMEMSIELPIGNVADKLMLVGAFLVDRDGKATDEEFVQQRMIWVYGQHPKIVEVNEDYEVLVDDDVILVDTTDRDVTVTLAAGVLYAGRPLEINHWKGSGVCTAETLTGDTFDDESETFTIAPGETWQLRPKTD